VRMPTIVKIKLLADELQKFGALICIVTAASLCGYEGFYLDLAGMRKHLNQEKFPQTSEEEATNLPHVAGKTSAN
jgi:glutathione peroxidase-family protein